MNKENKEQSSLQVVVGALSESKLPKWLKNLVLGLFGDKFKESEVTVVKIDIHKTEEK